MVKTGAGVASVIETLEKRAHKKNSGAKPNRSSAERSVSAEPEVEPGSNRKSNSSSGSSSSSLDLVSSADEFPAPRKCPPSTKATALKKLKTRHRKASGICPKSDSVYYDNDFHWVQTLTEDNSSASSKTLNSKDDLHSVSNSTPVMLRRSRGTGSLDRNQIPRKERDKRCQSTSSYSKKHLRTNLERSGSRDCCGDFEPHWYGSSSFLNYQRSAQMLSCFHHCSHNALPLCCQLDMMRSNRYAKVRPEVCVYVCESLLMHDFKAFFVSQAASNRLRKN